MSTLAEWQEQNRAYLLAALDAILSRVQDGDDAEAGLAEQRAAGIADGMAHPPALARLSDELMLSPFERDVVLLCLGQEVDARFRPRGAAVSIGHALNVLPNSHWGAFAPAGALRRWDVVQVEESAWLGDAGLRLDSEIGAYLLGLPVAADARFEPARSPVAPFHRQVQTAQGLVHGALLAVERTGSGALVELSGATSDDRVALAAQCAELLDANLATVDVRDLVEAPPDLDRLARRWSRHGRLTATLLLVDHTDATQWPQDPRVRSLLRADMPVLFVSSPAPATVEATRPVLRHTTAPLNVDERVEVWAAALTAAGRAPASPTAKIHGQLHRLAVRYRLSAVAIEAVALEAQAAGADSDDEELAVRLEAGCRQWVRARLDPVAERVPLGDLPDVELPERERGDLDELVRQIRLSHLVDDTWGMARGVPQAVVALFAGPSGTGKTHAALTVARDVGFDLYRINLASVLSKYIGETEKNLQEIFDAANLGGAILLFDEADALFGKRSEVRDSHDRYANLTTAYLLHQVERAAVPAILTTNMKQALDPAFTRRLHFVVEFPFPDVPARERIWGSIFPAGVPTRRIAKSRLGQLVVTGGTIRNVARRAAFLAAGADKPVEMIDLRESASREARKLERDLAPEELAGW